MALLRNPNETRADQTASTEAIAPAYHSKEIEMKMFNTVAPPSLALALLCAIAPMAHAQDNEVAVEARQPIQFTTGGIGQSDEAAMRRTAKNFNVRLEFSERQDNEFVADADLRITDRRGSPVFVLLDADPMVNLNLPAGRYRVAATHRGQTETRLVDVHGAAGANVFFHWSGQTDEGSGNRKHGA